MKNQENITKLGLLSLLFGLAISVAGCTQETRTRNQELPVAPPLVSPGISQVMVPPYVAGIQNNAAGMHLGYSVAVGDFDGDGNADAAVGAPGADNGVGAVAILYGADTGFVDNDNLNDRMGYRAALSEAALAGFGNGDTRAGDQFGYAVAAGDFDADGYMDLAIGAPYRTVGGAAGSGEVFIAYGTDGRGPAELVGRTARITQTGAGAANETGDHFGMSLVAGDFDGDGYDDLAVGAPDEDLDNNRIANAGAVFIRYGSRRGLTSDGYHNITAIRNNHGSCYSLPCNHPAEANERFGFSLASGNLRTGSSDDGVELAIGAPGKDVWIPSATNGDTRFPNAGTVYVYNCDYRTRQLTHSIDIIPSTWPDAIEGFGSSLAVGDFNGDGQPDLAAGAPDAGLILEPTGGQVLIMMHNAGYGFVGERAFPLNGTNWLREADRVFDEYPIGVAQNGDKFGFALAAVDFNLDGNTDLAIGAPLKNWQGQGDTGLVYVLSGTENGLSRARGFYYFISQSAIGDQIGATEPDDRFGFALGAGDINHDGRPDLVIGAPYENRRNADNGAVFLALTTELTPGPFEGRWTGTINGVNDTSATLTLNLLDRGRQVSGSVSMDHRIEKTACGIDVSLDRNADVNATKASEGSHSAAGTLDKFDIPAGVSAKVGLSMTVSANGNTLTGTISVTKIEGPFGGCDDVVIPNVQLTKVP